MVPNHISSISGFGEFQNKQKRFFWYVKKILIGLMKSKGVTIQVKVAEYFLMAMFMLLLNKVCAYWLSGRAGRENIWLEVMLCARSIPPTQSIGILSCDLNFYVVQKREEGEGLVNKWSASKGARVNWTTNDSRYFMNERKRAKKSFNHYTNNCT